MKLVEQLKIEITKLEEYHPEEDQSQFDNVPGVWDVNITLSFSLEKLLKLVKDQKDYKKALAMPDGPKKLDKLQESIAYLLEDYFEQLSDKNDLKPLEVYHAKGDDYHASLAILGDSDDGPFHDERDLTKILKPIDGKISKFKEDDFEVGAKLS